MYKSSFAVLILLLSELGLSAAAQDRTPPTELVQYVRDAKKSGLNDSQIHSNAVKAGWTAADIDSAIASLLPANSSSKKNMNEKADASGPKGVANPKPEAQPAISAAVGKPASVTLEASSPQPPASQPPASQKAANIAAPAAGGGPRTAPVGPEGQRNHDVPDDYQIGAGDVLQINVWGEQNASVPGAVVRPDGKISMPLIKEVEVLGLTEAQAEKLISGRLTSFINVPDVTVVISSINSKKIYLVGEINKQSPIPYTYRMTVMQAISEAGGLSAYAKRKKIYILHNEDGRSFQFAFNYDEVLKGEHMEQNRQLMPGDTIVVPH